MARARKNGQGVEKFGHPSRAAVRRSPLGYWLAYVPGSYMPNALLNTHADALAYALGEVRDES